MGQHHGDRKDHCWRDRYFITVLVLNIYEIHKPRKRITVVINTWQGPGQNLVAPLLVFPGA
jgi:hypothetical protein